jgi:phenylpropionate dioxygenase-like ring-hydroxylating dioxygenase large terminal subunit
MNVDEDAAADQRLAMGGWGSVPLWPASWYRFGSVAEIAARPVSKNLLGRRLVAFRTAANDVAVLDARCPHMHADLGGGQVVGESIQCPFHHWRFGVDGSCVEIPCAGQPPAFARVARYPTRVRHGQVYFFFGPRPLFELPFFADEEPAEFAHSATICEELQAPWYMVSINSVDRQHFRIAHDRRLLDDGVVEYPAPFVHRAEYRFAIEGTSLSDRFTRAVGGPEVRLQVTEWGGTVILARATLARATTWGVLFLEPRGPGRTIAHIMVLARRSRSGPAGRLLDRVRTAVRLRLIRTFLRADIPRMKGTHVRPQSLIREDRDIGAYIRILCSLPSGGPEA